MLAIITGAYGGLGRALSECFWEAGYNLMLVGRNESELESLKDSLHARARQECKIGICDLGQASVVRDFLASQISTLDRIDVLINNAAVHGEIGLSWETDLEELHNVLQVNFLAPVAFCRAVIPVMISANRGSIINLSGGGATSPRPMFSAYASSKSALIRFSETVAEEVDSYKIKINCVSPGAMPTKLLAEVIRQGSDVSGIKEFETAKKVFSQVGSSTERVEKLALFLAARDSDGITGKTISAVWDSWDSWPDNIAELSSTDVYTLRRIAGRDRNMSWGDK
ncbi:SDR family oxidoreductase [Luminiphilus sp.]|nr:SDR family oxidoreductase [Luminiphilus sp.]